jgi:hypothetical protein
MLMLDGAVQRAVAMNTDFLPAAKAVVAARDEVRIQA